MRILYIHQFFATRESSLGLIRSYEFSRRWIAEEHDVTMVTSASRLPRDFSSSVFTHADVDGIDVRSVRVAYDNAMGAARRILSFLAFAVGATWLALRAPRPDVVYATSTPLTVAIPALVVSRMRRCPLVFEVRDLWPEAAIQMGVFSRSGPLSRLAKALERAAYGRSSAVVALSPGMAQGVLDEGVRPEHVHVVPNCSDLDLFAPGEKDADLVALWGLGDRFVVGYTGAVGPTNAVEDSLPEAARILEERGRDDIVFVVVGDGKSLPALRERIDEQGLANIVVAGPMPKSDIPRVTRTADVLLTLFADVPILATNSPNKFFDGLASGRPMIVNSPGWTRDIVVDEECGLYVPPGDGAALADAIERLADEPELVRSMGERARHVAEERFDRNTCARTVLEILEGATSSTAPGLESTEQL
jgi:glycosyltransferase involved in cell wall biosynthesis